MRSRVFLVLGLAVFILSPVFSSTASAADAQPGQTLAVTVSIPPQKYFVERIGGDAVAVTVMAAKGQDPHSYEPTAAQMEGITRAEVYFAIGVPFETQWLPKFRDLSPAMRVITLSSAVEKLEGKPDLALRGAPGKGGSRSDHREHSREGHDEHHDGCEHGDHDHASHGHGGHRHDGHGHDGHSHGGHHHHGLETDDPHTWLSPAAMLKTIPLMVAALAEKRPEQAETFKQRGLELVNEVVELDSAIRELFDPLPGKDKLFLTFHQSWAYYAHNFALREVSVELEGREPGPKSMALLMDFAKGNNVRVIVADSMTSQSAVGAIAKNINAKVVVADPLAEDWPQALKDFSERLAQSLAGDQ